MSAQWHIVLGDSLGVMADMEATPPGGVVLDPFAGNATTGIVANRSGRRFIGIELDEHWHACARRRLEDDSPLFAGLRSGGAA